MYFILRGKKRIIYDKVLQNVRKYCKIYVSQTVGVIMAVKTNNIYGKIIITDKTIEDFIYHVAMDCYGLVRFYEPKNAVEAIVSKIKYGHDIKGVNIHTSGDRIVIDVAVIVKYGVSIKAVIEALKESLQYKVERFTGMIVDLINVNVMGVEK